MKDTTLHGSRYHLEGKRVSKKVLRLFSRRIRRNGTGKYTVRSVERESVANRLLYSSAWSCRTGKRIKSSLEKKSEHILTSWKSGNKEGWVGEKQNLWWSDYLYKFGYYDYIIIRVEFGPEPWPLSPFPIITPIFTHNDDDHLLNDGRRSTTLLSRHH